MKNTLFIDTGSNKNLSLALFLWKERRFYISKNASVGNIPQTKKIPEYTAQLFEKARLKRTDLEEIYVTRGPGSYTGLRIGLSFGKGLALAGNIPLYGLPTFTILFEVAKKKVLLSPTSSVFCFVSVKKNFFVVEKMTALGYEKERYSLSQEELEKAYVNAKDSFFIAREEENILNKNEKNVISCSPTDFCNGFYKCVETPPKKMLTAMKHEDALYVQEADYF